MPAGNRKQAIIIPPQPKELEKSRVSCVKELLVQLNGNEHQLAFTLDLKHYRTIRFHLIQGCAEGLHGGNWRTIDCVDHIPRRE